MNVDFSGPYALITGASGGLGEAFARLLASEGYGLVLVARDERELNRIAGILTAEHNLPIHVLGKDLSKPNAATWIIDELQRRNLKPHVLINNAGFGLAGQAAHLSATEQVAMIELNISALSELTLRLLPMMSERGTGGVINVASIAGFMPGPFMAVYYASKAYVISFSEALAHELADTGVTITTLSPGPIDTGFFDRAGMGKIPLFRFIKPAKPQMIAEAAWEGFKAGETSVIPGFTNQLAAFMGRFLPRKLTMKLVAKIQNPKHQDSDP